MKLAAIFFTVFALFLSFNSFFAHNAFEKKDSSMNIKIILGSTRAGRLSEKLGKKFQEISEQSLGVTLALIDLEEYDVPFLNDKTPPMMRSTISDPIIQRWAKEIASTDAFIILVPEYNAGYPGVLKNALDSLYKEWNNKPVAFIGYSGGPDGGLSAIEQLKQVTNALQMVSIQKSIMIPFSHTLLNDSGHVVLNDTIQKQFIQMLHEIITLLNK